MIPCLPLHVCHVVMKWDMTALGPNIPNSNTSDFQWISDHQILTTGISKFQVGSLIIFFLFIHLKTSTWWKIFGQSGFSNFLSLLVQQIHLGQYDSDIYPLIFSSTSSKTTNPIILLAAHIPFPRFRQYQNSLAWEIPINWTDTRAWFYHGKQ